MLRARREIRVCAVLYGNLSRRDERESRQTYDMDEVTHIAVYEMTKCSCVSKETSD